MICQEHIKKTTNLLERNTINGLEAETRGIGPVQGHLNLFLFLERAPDNGVVLFIVGNIIGSTALWSIESGGLLENNPFAEELGQDDLFIQGSILNSLGCDTNVSKRSSSDKRMRHTPKIVAMVLGWRLMRTTDPMVVVQHPTPLQQQRTAMMRV